MVTLPLNVALRCDFCTNRRLDPSRGSPSTFGRPGTHLITCQGQQRSIPRRAGCDSGGSLTFSLGRSPLKVFAAGRAAGSIDDANETKRAGQEFADMVER